MIKKAQIFSIAFACLLVSCSGDNDGDLLMDGMSISSAVVSNEAQLQSEIFYVDQRGTLGAVIDATSDRTTLISMKVIGEINGDDMKTIASLPVLRNVDLSGALFENNTIPNGVFSQAKFAKIVFNESLQSIDDNAFNRCQNLEGVKLPSSVTYIGKGAFADCSQMKEVDLGGNVKVISEIAFPGCVALEKINLEGVERIEGMAFSACYSLKEFVIPASLRFIGSSALGGVGAETQLVIPEDVELEKSSLNGSLFSEVVLPLNIETIPSSLCFNMPNLKRVDLPSSVRRLESQAFSSCSSLTEINLNEGLEYIGGQAFAWSQSVATIDIPQSVKVIVGEAFMKVKEIKLNWRDPRGKVTIDLEGKVPGPQQYLLKVKIPRGTSELYTHVIKGGTVDGYPTYEFIEYDL